MLDKKAHILLQGGQEKINRQHIKGKLTARERINLLFDPGTFVEYNMFVKPRATRFGMDKVDAPADGIVTGTGLSTAERLLPTLRTPPFWEVRWVKCTD